MAASARATAAALTGAAAALGAGVSGALAPPVALAVAVGLSGGLVTLRLVRRALTIHAAQHTFTACRGAGFLGMGVLAATATAVVSPVVATVHRPGAAAVGLAAAAAMFLLGLMLLPGAVPSAQTRLRHGFDGLSIGVTLAFTFWLLASPGSVPPLAFAEGLIVAAGLAVVTVVVARAAAVRRAALLCGAGVALTLLGLAGLAVPLAYGLGGRALLGAAAGLVAGPLVICAGARRASAASPGAGSGAVSLAGYPLLTVPVGAALLMAFYHLVIVGGFDRTAMRLGLASAALLAVREGLAAGDVRRYARRLARQEAHFRSLVAGAHDLILVLDRELVVRWQSPAAARLFGLSDQEVLGRPFLALLHPDDAGAAGAALRGILARRADPEPPPLAARLRDGFGHWRDTESTVSDQRDGPEAGTLVLHLRDVGERRHLERALHRMSSVDQLTGLPNRHELVRALAARRGRPGPAGAVLAIDLHGLGAVNDERGREVGDAVLIEVARRLRAAVGPDDLPARLAGDEFGVLAAAGPVQAYALGTRLLADLTRPYELPGAVVVLHASVGLAEAGDADVDDLLQRADLARRRAQQLGTDRLEWYDSCLEEQLVRHLDLERELPRAIERGELDLVFQPVVHLLDRRPAGVEALLRWRRPGLGTVLPAEIIPVAEALGIAAEIGHWVVAQGCRHLSSWLDAGNDVWLAVNVSPVQLAAPDFVRRVADALAAHRLPPERLVVEVAGGRLGGGAGTAAAANQLAGLRALGARTALDDFGGGQASLAHLRRLPIDILKLDGMLVSEPMAEEGSNRQVLDVAVTLGRRLGMELVAEGLESRSRLDAALRAGCRLGQGFLLGRPMPAERLEAYLEDFRAPSL